MVAASCIVNYFIDNVLTEETTIIVPTWMKDEEEDDWSPLRFIFSSYHIGNQINIII